ncbi:MAG: MFS transporter [Ignavibacteriaceae bacterium]|nr:MFS transporter [Ignavibacterium sp.]MCC6254669.1 MFS transporter [Ignavibacteriaceae bacterium]HRN25215.1 MFS transporter [Ignavibacteriaceae bacterium]HRQ52949.1 MFS transporter [Ignavibacteriaceae bacterium]
MNKPRLSFWQIWNMSFGFLGIQFGFALQNANVSRIFETLGASIDAIPILWIAAPVTGLIVQPIIGHWSDKTWNKLGRRRPFFLVGALLASAAIIFMPNSPTLWVAAGMLWIMDASINISMEPFRAFVGDMLPSEQRTVGFSMQSFFIGVGAIVASALPYMMTNWFGIANTAPAGEIPDSVKFSFYIGGAVFLLAVLYTVFSTKEYSPEELKKFSDAEKKLSQTKTSTTNLISAASFNKNGLIWIFVGLLGSAILHFILHENDFGLYVLFVGSIIFGLLQLAAGFFTNQNKTSGGLVSILNDLYKMPKTMKQLAVVQFFSWFALFAMWIYTTPAVTHHIYGATDPASELYNQGADWVGVLMSVYNGFAAVMAFVIMWIAKITNRKTVHMISLIIGGISFASFYFIKDPNLLLVSELGIGLAWASILAMPYAILAGSLPAEKMGVYMGIFNFFIVIPQITAAAILGFFVKNIVGGEAIYALLLGGVSMIIAGLFTLIVDDVD